MCATSDGPGSATLSQLTPGGDAYNAELSLARLDERRHVAVWIRRNPRERNALCWRLTHGTEPGPIRTLKPTDKALSAPRVCGGRLFWLEFARGRGELRHAAFHPEGERTGLAAPVRPLAAQNLGEFACATDAEGRLWLLCEVWRGRHVSLQLLRFGDNAWSDFGLVAPWQGFSHRPRLVLGASGLMAAWDEFEGGRCRVWTAAVTQKGSRPLALPAPVGCWETLPAVACDAQGRWFAARCRESLVELDGGVVTHHSRLVVSTREAVRWRDVAEVCIDHAMNPWEAAYVGLRRFPRLVPRRNGVWLLWEEKLDAKTMSPNLGRLCALPVTAEGADGLSRQEYSPRVADQPAGSHTTRQPEGCTPEYPRHYGDGPPRIALDQRCMFILADGASDDEFLVASKTQPRRYIQRLPWFLHRVSLGDASPPRPGNLATNRDAPRFFPHVPAWPQMALEHQDSRRSRTCTSVRSPRQATERQDSGESHTCTSVRFRPTGLELNDSAESHTCAGLGLHQRAGPREDTRRSHTCTSVTSHRQATERQDSGKWHTCADARLPRTGLELTGGDDSHTCAGVGVATPAEHNMERSHTSTSVGSCRLAAERQDSGESHTCTSVPFGRPALEQEGWSLYFGDPHLHSRFSQDLDGEQDELYHFARHAAKLDFVCFTENDFTWFTEPLSAADWERIRRHARCFDEPGQFTALLGYEFTKHRHP
ncbi:MAG: hypothetical protein FJ279_18910, partial [Planctomycetes bacterium]|nr:hypothetical protein [Planctomycetota bacterium]